MDLQQHEHPGSDYPDGLPFDTSYSTSLSQPCTAESVPDALGGPPYCTFYDELKREGPPDIVQMHHLPMGMDHSGHPPDFYQPRYSAAQQQIWALPSTEGVLSIGSAAPDSIAEGVETYSLTGTQTAPAPPVIESCQAGQTTSSPQAWSMPEQQQIQQGSWRPSPEQAHESSRLRTSEVDTAILTSSGFCAPPPVSCFGHGSFATSYPRIHSPRHGLYAEHGYFAQAPGAESFAGRLTNSDSTAYSDSSALSCGAPHDEMPPATAPSSEDGCYLSGKPGTSGGTAKSDEPYAQLIYKAFLSSPRRAMTLQEIYQWFRDNTDKANKPENKGWQNSIRHNLSMNWAFAKKERETGQDGDANDVGKKSSEWVLEPWAIVEGVQSTTRYRKGNPSRRRASGPNSTRYSHGSGASGRSNSLRVLSGRKGGVQASKSKRDTAAKNGGTRKPQQQQQHTSAPATEEHFEPFHKRTPHGARDESQPKSMDEDAVGLGLDMDMGLDPAARVPSQAQVVVPVPSMDSSYRYYSGSNGYSVDHVKSEPYTDEPMTPAEIALPDDGLIGSTTGGCSGSENNMAIMQPGLGGSGMDAAPYVLGDVVGIYDERVAEVADGGAGPPLFCEPDEVPGEISRSMPPYYTWNDPVYEY